MVGGAAARRLRLLARQPDESRDGARDVRGRLPRTGPALLAPRCACQLDGALPAHRRRAAGPRDDLDGDDAPLHHPLPTGEPNRGDELLWVTTQIAKHADAGTLDENNHHILNAQIDARLEQWLHAIDAAAARRKFIIECLIAATSNYSIVANEQLHTTRAALTVAETENRHWRSLLLGQ